MRKVLIATAVLIVLVWLIPYDPPPDGQIQVPPPVAPVVAAPEERSAPTVRAIVASDEPALPLDAPETEDELLDRIVHKLADALFGKVSASLVDELTSKGLSPEDSARMVREGVREWAKCQLDATLAQAAAQQMPRQTVLDTVDATQVPPPGIDAAGVLQRLTPCVEGVRQRMGLPANAPLRRTRE